MYEIFRRQFFLFFLLGHPRLLFFYLETSSLRTAGDMKNVNGRRDNIVFGRGPIISELIFQIKRGSTAVVYEQLSYYYMAYTNSQWITRVLDNYYFTIKNNVNTYKHCTFGTISTYLNW